MAQFDDGPVVEMAGKLAQLLPSVGHEGVGPMEFFTHIEEQALIFLPREFHFDGDTFDERFVFTGPCLSDRSATQGSWTYDGTDPVLFISLGTAFTGWSEFLTMVGEAFGHTAWHVVLAVGNHVDPASLGAQPAKLGVGRYLEREDTTAETLRTAVTDVAQDAGVAANVEELSAVMRKVDGPTVAAGAIERRLAACAAGVDRWAGG